MSVTRVILLGVWLTICGFIMIYLWFQSKYRYWSSRGVKSTRPTFPLGDIKQAAFKKHIGDAMKDIYDKFKGERFAGLWVLYKPFLMLRDPELIKAVLVKDFKYFHDRGLYCNKETDPLLGNMFFMNGKKWRDIRKELSSCFSSGRLKEMFQVLQERGRKLVEVLQEAAEGRAEVDVKEILLRFNNDVTSAIFLGVQPDLLTNPDSEFRQMARNVFTSGWNLILRTLLSFFLPEIAKLLKMANTPKSVTKFFMDMFKDVVDQRETKDVHQNDYVQQLIDLKNGESDKNMESGFDLNDAAAQAYIMWIAGFENASSSMQFALYELSKNQAVQLRAREEVTGVMERHGGKLTYQGVQDMEYLGRIIEESLRLYPPLSILSRECSEAYSIPDSETVIEKGVPLIIPVLALHKDPAHFPDPEKFDPERFTEERKNERHRYTYLPFGEGPRSCIGKRFALIKMRVALALLLYNFQFDICQTSTSKPVCDKKLIIYSPRKGIRLQISKTSLS